MPSSAIGYLAPERFAKEYSKNLICLRGETQACFATPRHDKLSG